MRLPNFAKSTLSVLILCAVLTGCSDTGTQSASSGGGTVSTPSVTSGISAPAESTPADKESSLPAESSTTESSSATSPTEITGESSEPSDVYTTSESDTDPLTSEAPTDSQPEVTSSVQQTTTATTTTAATTKAPERPPAPVVIPDVKMPSSPGTAVINAGGSGVIDYSSASEGYISVTYTGSAPKVKLRIVCGDITYNHNVPIDGTTKYFPLSCGSGEYTILLYENVEANMYSTAAEQNISVTISDATSPFTYPNYYIEFDKTSACVKKGAELCAGLEGTVEKIAAIFEYVTENVSYDKALAASPPSGYVPFPDRTLQIKKGICYDYASLFAAMTRSQGIPTRLCIGYASPDIYHAWNEVYTPETGWITPELFLKNKGYNLVDATFYSGSGNKAQIAEYISNNANYSVIYYY